MNRYEEKFLEELQTLHRSTFRLALGLQEGMEWTVGDALSNHAESLQEQEFRYLWLSEPESLSEQKGKCDVLFALKPHVANAKGRAHASSLTSKPNLETLSDLARLAKRRKQSFAFGRFPEIRWHAIRGTELPPVSVVVGRRLKKSVTTPPGATDAVRDPKGNLFAGVFLAHLDDNTRIATFTTEQVDTVKKAAQEALGRGKIDLHIVIGAEPVQSREVDAAEAATPAAADPAASKEQDAEYLAMLEAHFRDLAVDIFEVPFHFGRAERRGPKVGLELTLEGKPGFVSVAWGEALGRDGTLDDLLCSELTQELNEFASSGS